MFAGPACGKPGPRIWVVGIVAGAVSDVVGLSHDQFQIQFHVQSRDSLLPVSVDVDVALPSQIESDHVQFHGFDAEAVSGPED